LLPNAYSDIRKYVTRPIVHHLYMFSCASYGQESTDANIIGKYDPAIFVK